MTFQGDPYRTLGVAPGASLNEIRSAYRRLAKQYHPDAAGERALPRFLADPGRLRAAGGWGGPAAGSGSSGGGARGAGGRATARERCMAGRSHTGPSIAGRVAGAAAGQAVQRRAGPQGVRGRAAPTVARPATGRAPRRLELRRGRAARDAPRAAQGDAGLHDVRRGGRDAARPGVGRRRLVRTLVGDVLDDQPARVRGSAQARPGVPRPGPPARDTFAHRRRPRRRPRHGPRGLAPGTGRAPVPPPRTAARRSGGAAPGPSIRATPEPTWTPGAERPDGLRTPGGSPLPMAPSPDLEALVGTRLAGQPPPPRAAAGPPVAAAARAHRLAAHRARDRRARRARRRAAPASPRRARPRCRRCCWSCSRSSSPCSSRCPSSRRSPRSPRSWPSRSRCRSRRCSRWARCRHQRARTTVLGLVVAAALHRRVRLGGDASASSNGMRPRTPRLVPCAAPTPPTSPPPPRSTCSPCA